MGLSITFTQREQFVCPDCGKMTGYRDIRNVDSSGRVWYELLKKFGYYVQGFEADWYGKDMVLTKEQAQEAYRFTMQEATYQQSAVSELIARALLEGHAVVINADW
jgi:hypothetical protein